MSLRHIVDALGGDLFNGGREASVPGPGHSAADRSVSLLLEGDRVIVNSHGRSTWQEVLDDLRDRGLIDRTNRITGAPGVPVTGRPSGRDLSQRERLDAAQRVWAGGRQLASLAADHCRLRGLTGPLPGPEALRYHPDCPVSVYEPGRARRPALLAGILDASGVLVAVEITYLDPNGKRTTNLRLSRKTVGAPPGAGCAVRLDPIAAHMLVGEGVFTTHHAGEHFGLPCWALQSARNLRGWTPPEGVRRVTIAGDRGQVGESAAGILRDRIVGLGLQAEVALPPRPFGQWDEYRCRRAAVAG